MNEYIFYTLEGFTSPPREDKEVENCQLLGCVQGNNIDEARMNLEQRCPWIEECGFNIYEAFIQQLLTEESKQDIRTVIQYLWNNEYKNFQETDEPNDHIYHTLLRLRDLIS